MGVMACERGNCDEIMCSRLILDSSMYICSRCYKQLLEAKATWKRHIEEFMETNPGDYQQITTEEQADEAFEELTADLPEDS